VITKLHAVPKRIQRALPLLDAVLKDPASARGLEPEEIIALLSQNVAVQSALTVALLAKQQHQSATPEADDHEMLTVEQAAAIIHRSRTWIWRHARTLPWVIRISAKSLLCSKNGIEKWLASRRGH